MNRLAKVLSVIFLVSVCETAMAQVKAPLIACSDYNCFEQALVTCTPAVFPFKLGLRGTTANAKLKIVSGNSKDCRVKLNFSVSEESECVFSPLRSKTGIWPMDVLANCNGRIFNALYESGAASQEPKMRGADGHPKSLDGIVMDINIPKNEYKTGENMGEASYAVSYSGNPFAAWLVVSLSKKGVGGSSDEIQKLVVGPAEKSGKLAPFHLAAGGYAEKDLPFFREEGKYKYSLILYDCESLEKKFKQNCDDIKIGADELKSVKPLRMVAKDVIVKGKADLFACSRPEDCDAPCEKCATGKNICDVSMSQCVECLLSSDCDEGFKCDSNTKQCIPLIRGECNQDDDCAKKCNACLRGAGKQWCYKPLEKRPPYQCVDCAYDGDCRAGFLCQKNRCVKQ